MIGKGKPVTAQRVNQIREEAVCVRSNKRQCAVDDAYNSKNSQGGESKGDNAYSLRNGRFHSKWLFRLFALFISSLTQKPSETFFVRKTSHMRDELFCCYSIWRNGEGISVSSE